jgi:hypothetical protein
VQAQALYSVLQLLAAQKFIRRGPSQIPDFIRNSFSFDFAASSFEIFLFTMTRQSGLTNFSRGDMQERRVLERP